MELSGIFTMFELPVTGWFMGSRNRGSLICTLLRYLSNVASNLQSAIKGPSKMVAPESDSKSIDVFLFGNRKKKTSNQWNRAKSFSQNGYINVSQLCSIVRFFCYLSTESGWISHRSPRENNWKHRGRFAGKVQTAKPKQPPHGWDISGFADFLLGNSLEMGNL